MCGDSIRAQILLTWSNFIQSAPTLGFTEPKLDHRVSKRIVIFSIVPLPMETKFPAFALLIPRQKLLGVDTEKFAEVLTSTSTTTRGSVIKRRLKDHQAMGKGERSLYGALWNVWEFGENRRWKHSRVQVFFTQFYSVTHGVNVFPVCSMTVSEDTNSRQLFEKNWFIMAFIL